MKKLLLWSLGACLFVACNEKKPVEPAAPAAPAAPTETPQAEFADKKYSDMGKNGLAQLAKGDVDSWAAGFADNAVYHWNSGDSLAGKAAITAYWKKRRTEVIDSLTFANEIWLPIKVNKPQSVEQPGNWLLGWYMVTAKYKTGKSMTQWMHVDIHYDANDKIDAYFHYLDRAPINEATKK